MRGGPTQPQLTSRSSAGGGIPPPSLSQREPSDPFEPTPVSQILERQQQKAALRTAQPPAHPTHMTSTASSSSSGGRPHHPGRPVSYSAGPGQRSPSSATSSSTIPVSNVRSGVSVDQAARERDTKKQKERFLIFTRVLMKYLEQKDPELHKRVRAIIKDCADRNKRHEPGYESVTTSMRSRLREVVSDAYWKRAEVYLNHFLQQRAKQNQLKQQQQGLPPSSTSGMVSSSSNVAQEAAARQKAELERMRQQMQDRQAGPRPTGSSASMRSDGPKTIAGLRQDIANQRKVLVSGASGGSASAVLPGGGAVKPVLTGKGAGKGKSARTSSKTSAKGTLQRKPSTMSEASKAAMIESTQIVREYSNLVEVLEHVGGDDFDWTMSGLLMEPDFYKELGNHHKQVLYCGNPSLKAQPVHRRAFPLAGWSGRNVLSSRVVWARIRLSEVKRDATKSKNIVVGNGLLQLPLPKQKQDDASEAAASMIKETLSNAWHNEEQAEEDATLAALSEGFEIYLRRVLDKAIHCARRRENLDGVRLWHQQESEKTKPILPVRLGEDMSDQVSLAISGAALTCQQMEEALGRQASSQVSLESALDEKSLTNAVSLSEVALRPSIANAVQDASQESKRQLDALGSDGYPLGRVAKKARLRVSDFQLGMQMGLRQNRAETMSGSFAF